MRFLTVLLVFSFGLGVALAFYNPLALAQPGSGRGQGGGQFGGDQQGQFGGGQFGGGRQPGGGGGPFGGGQQPGTATPRMQGASPQIRPGQPGGQATPQTRPGQPGVAGAMNPTQITQAIARLRSLDANGNGILEADEIPANRRPFVDAIVTQLGGTPGGTVNLASLERRAANRAGDTQNTQRPPGQQQQPDQGAGTDRQRRQQTAEPLVQPFGEARPADAPALAFGQRDSAAQDQPTGRGGRQQRERDAAAAQANQQSAVQAAMAANTVRQSAAYDSISPAVRSNPSFSWFFEYDVNRDGQLSMLEYRDGNGGIWTDEIAGEFRMLDRNGDGFVTVDEALKTIQEWDEQRLKEAQEQQAELGLQPPASPRSAPVTVTPRPVPGTTPATGAPIRTPATNTQTGPAAYQRQPPTAGNPRGGATTGGTATERGGNNQWNQQRGGMQNRRGG